MKYYPKYGVVSLIHVYKIYVVFFSKTFNRT